MTSTFAQAALALLLACSAGFAFSQPVTYRVEIEAPRELRELLEARLPLIRWQSDPEMSESLLARLVTEAEAQVREAAATRGFFSARVRSSIDRVSSPWTVRLRVEPGEAARVAEAEIVVEGPAASDPQAAGLLERIRGDWTLRAGTPFTQDDWNDAKRAAAGSLARWRYAAAHVAESRALVDRERGEARLRVALDSGPAFRYGEVEVSGAERYPASLVAGLSTAPRGALYDRDTLALYERRLLATGYFVSAQVAVDDDPARATDAPVRVAVIEGRSQEIEAGLSFNTDVGPRLETRYRNMDLFDTAWRLNGTLQLDSRIRSGRLEIDAPPRAGGRWYNAFAQVSERRIQNEESTEFAAGAANNWGLGEIPSALYVSGHIEEQRIAGQLADHRHAVFVGYRGGWRDTDNWESPRRGYIAAIDLGGAPAALASQGFLRALGRVQLFLPLARNDLLIRAEVGAVHARSREGIPASFLFRTGGDRTIRGYAFESLGVRRGDVVLGARYLALGSVEYTHWIGEAWGLAAFVDAGNAWDGGRFDPAIGAGIGARLRTPIGPVRADLAYGFEDRALRVHFSVGFGF